MATAALAPGGSFYRGDTINKSPVLKQLATETGIQDYILKGWMPDKPFIGPHTNIVAFGSCFASNIGKYLKNLGFDVTTAREGKAHVQRISDGLVNVFAIAQQFEWAWENRTPSIELWHGWKAEDFGYDEEARRATKDLFDAADVFILTFGLSEVWYDEPTGETFWRAVPEGQFDKTRHKFRVATSVETAERLRKIYDLIRQYRPEATIIFTLSPVGLAATFRNVSCLSANSVSKALLRVGIDELYRSVSASDPKFFYFPAYEVVMNGFRTPFAPDLRHPQVHAIKANMKAFEHYFCTTGMSEETLRTEIKDALALDAAVTSGNREDVLPLLQELKTRWKVQADSSSLSEKRLQRREAKFALRREAQQAEVAAKQAAKVAAKHAAKLAAKQAAKLEAKKAAKAGAVSGA